MGELKFGLPIDGNPKVSSPYGSRINPQEKRRINMAWKEIRRGRVDGFRTSFEKLVKDHYGIDYAIEVGTPVKASERGRVVRAHWHEALGELIIIDHTPNAGKDQNKYFYSIYAHLSKYDVKLGDDLDKDI